MIKTVPAQADISLMAVGLAELREHIVRPCGPGPALGDSAWERWGCQAQYDERATPLFDVYNEQVEGMAFCRRAAAYRMGLSPDSAIYRVCVQCAYLSRKDELFDSPKPGESVVRVTFMETWRPDDLFALA